MRSSTLGMVNYCMVGASACLARAEDEGVAGLLTNDEVQLVA